MNNEEKYAAILAETLLLDAENVRSATVESTVEWDSIGKLNMVTALEDAFGIEFEAEDVMQFNSYADGLAILRRHGVQL